MPRQDLELRVRLRTPMPFALRPSGNDCSSPPRNLDSAPAPGLRSPSAPLAYRPDIDGLRALSVLAVVFYHAGLSCPGGFVGVDVFFVISGYLITALLLRDLRAGTFSFTGFWERRVRRIFPAGAVMVLVVLLAGAFLPSAADYAKLGWSALAQSGLVANLFFWRQGSGYFATTEFHPLLHMWSLAVEEQFYLFFPLVLWVLFRLGMGRRPSSLSGWLLAGALGSLLLAVAALSFLGKERAAFFLLPMRAWEMLAGALLAVSPVGLWQGVRRGWREGVAWLGLTGILAPVWLYSDHTRFPGLAALPPCLGAVAFIWANTRESTRECMTEERAPTFAGRLLAMPPLVFVGLISYSLYLWHWPVMVFPRYGLLNNETASSGLLLIAVSGALAVASWRWIETPFRGKRIARSRRGIFGLAVAVTVLTAVISGSVAISRGFPARFPEVVALNEATLTDRTSRIWVRSADVQAGRLPAIGVEQDGAPALLLWGDSHAHHTIPALDELCRELGISAEAAVLPGVRPVVNEVFNRRDDGPIWAESVLRHVEERGIKTVLLAARWSSATKTPEDEQRLESALRETILRLAELGCQVWVLQDVPNFDVVAPRALAATASPMRWGPRGEWRQTRERHRRENAVLERLAAEGLPAIFIDPAPSLLEPDGMHYRADHEGVSLYFDGNHLTTRGSKLVLLPLLRETIGEAWARGRTASQGSPEGTR